VRRRRWLGRGSGSFARSSVLLRRPGRDRGSFTAELAAGLPALMLLLFAGLAAVGAVSTKLQCVDAAREGAIAAARGDPGVAAAARIAPAASDVDVVVGPDSVTVTVGARVAMLGTRLPAMTVRAAAIAALEPEAGGALP
jgi:Flp pilus assembly protein TadG